jgi:hypothetical protein
MRPSVSDEPDAGGDHQFAGLRSPMTAVRIESFGLFVFARSAGNSLCRHIMFFRQAIQ